MAISSAEWKRKASEFMDEADKVKQPRSEAIYILRAIYCLLKASDAPGAD